MKVNHQKRKYCELGEHHVERLWKAKGKTQKSACKDCWMRYGTNTSEKKDKPLRKPISPVSPKQAQRLRTYRTVRDEYFKEHPICEYPLCNSREIQLHHMAGRNGDLLTDKRYFKSLCDKHHKWVELHPSEAKELGLSTDRLNK